MYILYHSFYDCNMHFIIYITEASSRKTGTANILVLIMIKYYKL